MKAKTYIGAHFEIHLPKLSRFYCLRYQMFIIINNVKLELGLF